ncbi:MAG: hypothetical protein E7007_03835 [Alphaproteobacteria bacterium]|nr:hypothetical protein [Alphaproteobacteria bacterium]
MKKSYVKLFVLVPFVTLASCKKTEIAKKGVFRERFNQTSVIKKNIDTVRVTGVHDVCGGWNDAARVITCVDNQGNEDRIVFDVMKKDSPMRGGEYIERGDTVVLKGDTLVKNITRERIKSEFVKVKS